MSALSIISMVSFVAFSAFAALAAMFGYQYVINGELTYALLSWALVGCCIVIATGMGLYAVGDND